MIPFSDSKIFGYLVIWLFGYLVICIYFIIPLVSHAHAHLIPLALTSSLDALLNPTLVSIPWAALHYYTEALLTSPGPWNSLWANFPPHAYPHFISFGLWFFATLGLCLPYPTNVDHLMALVLNCPGRERIREGEALRGLWPEETDVGSVVYRMTMQEITHSLQLLVAYPPLYGHWHPGPHCAGPVTGWKRPWTCKVWALVLFLSSFWYPGISWVFILNFTMHLKFLVYGYVSSLPMSL